MPQDSSKPREKPKIGLPKVGLGQNKTPPKLSKKAKPRRSKRNRVLGETASPPPLSESTDAEIDEPEHDEEETEGDEGKGGKSKAKDGESDEELLTRIRKRFERCIAFEAENRKEALEDLKFKKGDQWPANVATQRALDQRPCETVNIIPTYVNQITNDQRQNRPAIHVLPVGDKGDPEAAKIYNGLIRAIWRDSSADIAIDTAFDNAASCGFGYFRIGTEWEGPKSHRQVITVKRIRNPFTVYLDPDHQEPDGADCRYGFVTEQIPRDEFEKEFPDADPMPFQQQGVGEGFKEWIAKDVVRIAEYFEITKEKKTLLELENGWTGFEGDLSDDVKKRIESKAILVKRERESEVPSVKWYKVSAHEVLERNDWLGQWIPIIPVIGNEIDIEGKVTYSGVIRHAKGPQRIKNYAKTAWIENVGLAPKAPFIVEEGQIEGHEKEWKQANTRNFPYLSYKGVSVSGMAAPPPQRQGMVGTPAGWAELDISAQQDLMSTTGIRFDPKVAENRVDDSGRAIRELRRSSDLGAFHYIDNLSRSMKHAGRQIVDLVTKVMDERQITTIIREDDSEERIQIDPEHHKALSEGQDPANPGKRLKIFNPKFGQYGISIHTGPSYATKRVEAAESMMAFVKALPNTAALAADLIAKRMDWEGAEEIATRLAKAVPPQFMTADTKDIPPQVQAIMQAMDQQIKQLTQQLRGAIAALNDKDKDRAIALEKVHLDFEGKMFAVVQKAEDSFAKHVGNNVQEMVREVVALKEALGGAKPNGEAKDTATGA